MAITRSQQKFLLDRLEEIRLSKPAYYASPVLQEPASVVAARKRLDEAAAIISKWEEKKNSFRADRNNAIRKINADIKQLIFFGDSAAALKALGEFEKKVF